MIPNDDIMPCPYCFEPIKRQAIRCKHCYANLGDSASIQASGHATVGGARGVTIGGEGNQIGEINYFEEIHYHTLSELDNVDAKTKQELRLTYEKKVRDFPEVAQYHFALGLSYLDQRLYGLSVTHLHRALGKTARESDLLYSIALAQIEGKRPRVLKLSTVREIEKYLEAAIRLEPGRPHYKLLLAIVKYDYYVCNGLRVPPPEIDQLLRDARRDKPDPQEVRLLREHVTLPEGPLLSAIRQF